MCEGFYGTIFGHNFEAVYDESNIFKGDSKTVDMIVEKMHEGLNSGAFDPDYCNPYEELILALNDETTTYIHHVCKRCGVVVKK